MNSLEFIEKEIKDTKENILRWKSQIKRYPENEVFPICLNSCKKILQSFEQIKAELEAWGIAKAKEIDILSVKTANDLESFNFDLVKEYQLTDYEFKTLKKALEVEENDR